MYTDKNLKPISDKAPYIGADGTKYPGSYPKAAITGLHKFALSAQPADPALVVTGFYINDKYEQVWTTREKTEQEVLDELNVEKSRLAAEAQTKIVWTDVVALRCVKAGVPFTDVWQAYVDALRAVIRGESSELPVPPMDESGNIAYPLGS